MHPSNRCILQTTHNIAVNIEQKKKKKSMVSQLLYIQIYTHTQAKSIFYFLSFLKIFRIKTKLSLLSQNISIKTKTQTHTYTQTNEMYTYQF